MTKAQRTIAFFVAVTVLAALFFIVFGVDFLESTIYVILFSSMILLAFVTFYVEHFFTRPADVVANTISVLLLLSPLHDLLENFGRWYWAYYAYNLILLVIAASSILIHDADSSHDSIRNELASRLKRVAVQFGNGKIIYFSLVSLTLFYYVNSQSIEFIFIFVFALILFAINPKEVAISVFGHREATGNDIGQIIGVQSRNTFLAKLYGKRGASKRVKRFDIVAFKYSMENDSEYYKGIIVDNYLLNEQQWVKILSTSSIREILGKEIEFKPSKGNVVYKVDGAVVPGKLNNLAGVVVENSDIGSIKFEYAGKAEVREGTLLEVDISGDRVMYQVVQGKTAVESLESKNEASYILGTAVQLGVWNREGYCFDRYGWVPEVNTPIFLIKEDAGCVIPEDGLSVGCIPGTQYPVVVDIESIVTHHTAMLGVTGSGKSVFTRKLIRDILGRGTKVICVDFTSEYQDKFNDLEHGDVVSREDKKVLLDFRS